VADEFLGRARDRHWQFHGLIVRKRRLFGMNEGDLVWIYRKRLVQRLTLLRFHTQGAGLILTVLRSGTLIAIPGQGVLGRFVNGNNGSGTRGGGGGRVGGVLACDVKTLGRVVRSRRAEIPVGLGFTNIGRREDL